MTDAYDLFLEGKQPRAHAVGIDVPERALNPALFGWQRKLTHWALRKGRAALYADTGLGKTFMQLAWAEQIHGRVLILAPLVVAQQTVQEAAKLHLGDAVAYCRSQAEVRTKITVTNYEMVQHFRPELFSAVVLDESSLLKNYAGAMRNELTAMFSETPYRLCCTATPAPNDVTEFANQAEFLGVMDRTDLLATFFVHDDEGWRLKRPARGPFYRWLASWGMALSKPSDLGYDDDGFNLPPLSIAPHFVRTGYVPEGQLFATALHGVQDRSLVRRGTLSERVGLALDLIHAEPAEQWIAWCGMNEESRTIARALPDAVEVEGSQSPDEKAARILGWVRGETRVLVIKPKIAMFGLNLQNCARQVFVGLSDSYEAYYQCIRRSWRFGQQRPVQAHIVLSDLEEPIYANVLRKEREALDARQQLVANVIEFERQEIGVARGRLDYRPTQPLRLPDWLRSEERVLCKTA